MTLRVVSRWSAARRPASPARSSPSSGTTSRAAAVGVEARASAARSQSGVSCSWPTAETTGNGASGDGAHDLLGAEGEEVFEASAAAGEDDRRRSRARPRASARAAAMSARRPRPLHGGLRDEDPRGREARSHGGHEVALGRGLGARSAVRSGGGGAAARACAPRRRAPPRRASGGAARSAQRARRGRPARARAPAGGTCRGPCRAPGRPKTWIEAPSASSIRSASNVARGIETGRHDPSAGSLSVKKTLCQPGWRRNSVTSPSTQSVGRRASQSATPRLNADDRVDLAVFLDGRLGHPSNVFVGAPAEPAPEFPGRAGRREAASSVAPVSKDTNASLRPLLAPTIAPRKRGAGPADARG